MQYNQLPSECSILLFSYLNIKDIRGLSLLNKHHYEITSEVSLLLPTFLKYVGQREELNALNMLRINNKLALTPGTLVVHDKKFTNITSLQYALWSLDISMWELLCRRMSKFEIIKQVEQLTNGEWVQEHGIQIELEDFRVFYNYIKKDGSNTERTLYLLNKSAYFREEYEEEELKDAFNYKELSESRFKRASKQRDEFINNIQKTNTYQRLYLK